MTLLAGVAGPSWACGDGSDDNDASVDAAASDSGSLEGGSREPDSGSGGEDAAATMDGGDRDADADEKDASEREHEDAGTDAGTVDGGGAPDGYDDPVGASGTRLRRRYFEGGPGGYQTVDFWDTELALACKYTQAADAKQRCLPNKLDTVYFADAGCGNPIMLSGEDLCGHHYGRASTIDSPVYERTSMPAVLEGGMYYYLSGTSCVGVTHTEGTEYWVADLVPSVTFVGADTANEARADGMVMQVLVGEDGSRAPNTVFEQVRGTTCDFNTGEDRCIPNPTERGFASVYTDDMCTNLILQWLGDDAPAVASAFRPATSGCRTVEYFEAGADLGMPAALHLLDDEGMCQAVGVSATATYYALGDPLPLSAFPLVRLQTEGEGRVRARRRVDEDGAPLGAAHALWDAERDVECRASRFPDGTYRCVPTNTGTISEAGEYAADDCQTDWLGRHDCRPPGAYLQTTDYTKLTCSNLIANEVTQIYERGDAHEGPYHVDTGDMCEARELDSRYRHYLVGAPVEPEEFPIVTLKTE